MGATACRWRLSALIIYPSPLFGKPKCEGGVAERVVYVGVGLWTTRGYCTALRLRDVEDAVPYKNYQRVSDTPCKGWPLQTASQIFTWVSDD